jgi:hypothetical protein
MTYRYVTDLADVLRAAGLTVVELPGWKTRGRPASTGGFDPVGNLWHHTGGASNTRDYADWMALTGRSDLPAPLCQVAVDRAGRMYVSAAGRANHGGTAKPAGPVPGGDANELYIGWECMNTGGEGWEPVQYDAMVTAAAATSLHYGWDADANRAHKETSYTGKWDPGLLDMGKFRSDIANHMTSKDWFDMATEADLRKIVREEVAALLDTKQANEKTLRENIRIGANARDLAREILAEVKDK